MSWISLERLDQLDSISALSAQKPQLLFKHSTRCGTSSLALERMNRALARFEGKADCHLLDLIAHREVSNAIAERYHVVHESPQLLLIEGGECTLELSHFEIEADAVLDQLKPQPAAV